MLENALEASRKGDDIGFTLVKTKGECIFGIHNAQFIEDKYAKRVFQRNFSTKSGPGRGLGTYSMKYLAEKILGGKVFFTTNEENGTTFCLSLGI